MYAADSSNGTDSLPKLRKADSLRKGSEDEEQMRKFLLTMRRIKEKSCEQQQDYNYLEHAYTTSPQYISYDEWDTVFDGRRRAVSSIANGNKNWSDSDESLSPNTRLDLRTPASSFALTRKDLRRGTKFIEIAENNIQDLRHIPRNMGWSSNPSSLPGSPTKEFLTFNKLEPIKHDFKRRNSDTSIIRNRKHQRKQVEMKQKTIIEVGQKSEFPSIIIDEDDNITYHLYLSTGKGETSRSNPSQNFDRHTTDINSILEVMSKTNDSWKERVRECEVAIQETKLQRRMSRSGRPPVLETLSSTSNLQESNHESPLGTRPTTNISSSIISHTKQREGSNVSMWSVEEGRKL